MTGSCCTGLDLDQPRAWPSWLRGGRPLRRNLRLVLPNTHSHKLNRLCKLEMRNLELRKLQEARTDGGGSARHSSAKASDFDFDETRSSTPKAAPVPPIKAALGTFLRYSFYVGKFGIGISRSFVVEMCVTPGRAQGWHCSGLGRSFSRRPVCRSPHGIHKWWRIRRKS